MFVLPLGFFYTALLMGRTALGLLGMLVFYFVLHPVIRALLPASFLPAPRGAQATSALYRGWAAKPMAGLGLGASRTVEADAARLRRGVRLSILSYGLRDGSQVLGHLLLRQSPHGGVELAWRDRAKGATDQPIHFHGPLDLPYERHQQNVTQARLGYTAAVDLATDSYWVRPHDAALLQLVLGNSTPASYGAFM
ncbi:hypothetical protein [Streptomyces sp. NPDC005435]|uniref:hypothetical protein n=1 Tax=Streptomyces sp. NPDC005435 TaxID=3154464 RepID=UPI00345554BE